MIGKVSKFVARRIGNMVRKAQSLPLNEETRRVFDGSGGGAQRFAKLLSAQQDFTHAARWTYSANEVAYNPNTSQWDSVGSLFGLRNLNEFFNQTPIPAAPFYCGNGVRIEIRTLSFVPTPFWVGGLLGVDRSRYRLQPASTGTPIVPIFLVSGAYFFQLENGMDKLIPGCID